MKKNVVILYYPPFRGMEFPVHITHGLKEYNFFLFVSEEDYSENKKFLGQGSILKVIPIKYQKENLINACSDIIANFGKLSKVVHLDENCAQLSGEIQKYYGLTEQDLSRYTNKSVMCNLLKLKGVRTPRSYLFDEGEYKRSSCKYLEKIENDLGRYPYFIKPSSSSGSRDTCMIADRKELIKWISCSTFEEEYIIQEYLEGTLFHCESFVKDYNVISAFVFEYSSPGFFFTKGISVGSISLPENHPMTKRIKLFNQKVLNGLGIVENGVTHIEIYLNDEDELIFLEAAARPPGVLGEQLYRKYLNISIIETHFLLQIGEEVHHLSNTLINNYVARYIFPITRNGQVQKYISRPTIYSKSFEKFLLYEGEQVKKSQDFFNLAGVMLLWNKDFIELRNDFKLLGEYSPFEIKEIEKDN